VSAGFAGEKTFYHSDVHLKSVMPGHDALAGKEHEGIEDHHPNS
jgi:hypothetical protein